MKQEDLDKIKKLVLSEDENNNELARELLTNQRASKEQISEVYGLSLKLYLRMAVSFIFSSSVIYHMAYRGNRAKSSSEAYDNVLFTLPRLHCIDGFSFSIQIDHGTYCQSENGYRKLGFNWESAEWGFTSEHEPLLSDDSQDEHTSSSVGRSTIELLQEVIDKHGGINWPKTMSLTNLRSIIKTD